MAATVASSAAGGGVNASGALAAPPSLHDTSAGSISVATCPGGPMQAAIASTASWASASVLLDVRTQDDTLRATVSMSDCSWAS